MASEWTAENIMELAGSYKRGCILVAAAELNLFEILADHAMSSEEVAGKLATDLRGTTILLDALVVSELVNKQENRYTLAPNVGDLLAPDHPGSVLAMVQHKANCLRRWAQLARVVQSGKPLERKPSIRGEEADEAAFIEAMDNISGPVASQLVEEIAPLEFKHVLDVGGASGTWTIALLRSNPHATATLFDLPHVIPSAERRIADSGLAHRVKLVAGDFYVDPLPSGADLAWVSAIVHQNSREQNRRLFSAVSEALLAGGQILIRDILMDDSRTAPAAGALFAIHMLLATEAGGTFTFAELKEDLAAAGFREAEVLRRDEWMSSFIRAKKTS